MRKLTVPLINSFNLYLVFSVKREVRVLPVIKTLNKNEEV